MATLMKIVLFPVRNRWCQLAIFFLANLSSTGILFNWASIADILYKSGVYNYQCPDTWSGEIPCDEQNTSIQMLYILLISAFSVATLPAGYAYNKLGPAATGALGQFLALVGWTMLAFSSETVQLYIPAFFICAVSFGFIAWTSIASCEVLNFSQPGVAVVILMIAQSLAMSVPDVLQAIFAADEIYNLQTPIFWFIMLIFAPVSLLFIVCLQEKQILQPMTEMPRNLNLTPKRISWSTVSPQIDKTKSTHEEVRIENYKMATCFKIETLDKRQKQPKDCMDFVDIPMTPIDRGITASPILTAFCSREWNSDISKSMKSYSSDVEKNEIFALLGEICRSMNTPETDTSNLSKQLCSPYVILFTIYYSLSLLPITILSSSVHLPLAIQDSHVHGLITPLQIPFMILLAGLIDYIGTLSICLALSFINVLTCIFVYIGTPNLAFAAMTLYIFEISFIHTVKFTFIQEVFGATNFHILVGIIATIGGLASILNLLIIYKGLHDIALFTYAVIGGVFMIIIIFIMLKRILRWRNRMSNEIIKEQKLEDFSLAPNITIEELL